MAMTPLCLLAIVHPFGKRKPTILIIATRRGKMQPSSNSQCHCERSEAIPCFSDLTSVFVAYSGIHFLGEKPSLMQWGGTAITALGVGIYFLPVAVPQAQVIGILIALVCLAGNVFASLMGRQVNRGSRLSPLLVTFISMGIGSILMLGFGLGTQDLGPVSWQDWALIAWLAVVNTALAFTLWNRTLRALTAIESSIINSLMMPQIALLAFLFLDETLKVKEIFGLVLVGAGVLIVQIKKISSTSRWTPVVINATIIIALQLHAE
jgi:drug/metabolite transporter (DMT)-like permease